MSDDLDFRGRIIIPLIYYPLIVSMLLIIHDSISNYPFIKIILYWLIKGIVYVSTLGLSISLVYFVKEPIKRRIIPAFLIASSFMLFHCYAFKNMDTETMSETDMIASTFIDRSKMSYTEKKKLINDLKSHFRIAVSSSIRSKDCNSIDDFLDHLQVSTLTSNMSYNEKFEKIIFSYVTSYCKKRSD